MHVPERQAHDFARHTMTPLHSDTPTALTSWMRGLARELELRGLSSSALFAEVGLDHSLLDNPEARYPVVDTTRLWLRAVELTGDEALGLKAIRHITPATFHAVGLSVMASETLEQAFGRMSRFADLVTDASQIVISTRESTFEVELRIRDASRPAHQSVDGFMALLANAGKGLGSPELIPLRVELSRPEPQGEALDLFNKLFVAPVSFGQPRIALVYALHTVQTRLKGANPLVAEHLDQASLAAMERLKPATSLSRMLKNWARERLPHGTPTIEEAAQQVNMSARNLQRKLAEEGTSLAALIDDIRQTECLRRLKHTQDPLTAIALDLGFSDSSAFSRACKRWYGKSPSELR
ncbi:AraC family transcriptional regulator [Limnobacter humi]|uniref:AraC family transcriptional regulator n=1 Tax=Limnobacter humi TaxID=1778671 RepID=A0ABT1WCN3_9BURK|nr:AraC family transcriptional regulator [Limnobacter humi]MCQ8895276.1 AraC family transcriptional regulator [Limnobacter humi]